MKCRECEEGSRERQQIKRKVNFPRNSMYNDRQRKAWEEYVGGGAFRRPVI
jgi:hypothetical protein